MGLLWVCVIYFVGLRVGVGLSEFGGNRLMIFRILWDSRDKLSKFELEFEGTEFVGMSRIIMSASAVFCSWLNTFDTSSSKLHCGLWSNGSHIAHSVGRTDGGKME